MSFSVAHTAIDLDALRAQLENARCGGVVWFEGRVRDHNEGRAVERLEYEVYEPLCRTEGAAILAEARAQWPVEEVICVHRSGRLELQDIAVVVGVASPHRDEAFRAARYVIDQAKLRLPIWKKEHYADGDSHWVNCLRCAHPKSGNAA